MTYVGIEKESKKRVGRSKLSPIPFLFHSWGGKILENVTLFQLITFRHKSFPCSFPQEKSKKSHSPYLYLNFEPKAKRSGAVVFDTCISLKKA